MYGHRSAHLSTAWPRRIYARVDASDGVPCRPDASLYVYPWMLLRGNDPASTSLAPELSPIVRSHPPAFFAQASDDRTAWPQGSLVYSSRLLAAGHTPTLHLYPRGGHGFGLCQELKHHPSPEVCDWAAAAGRWLRDIGLIAPPAPESGGFPLKVSPAPVEEL